jgi:hypothetical protein
LVLALGKDGNAYLVNRNNLGGIAAPVAQANVMGINRGISAVTYHTSQGTYIAFHNDTGQIRSYKINATSPPTIAFAWFQNQTGRGSPWVTTTDGTNNTIVWVAGVSGDQRIHGYDGDTGAVIYAGGGANELMTGTQQWNTGIAARGHIYFGANNKVYAFMLAAASPTPTPTATATATPGPIMLRGQGKKVGGINTSRLKWRGATSANVDVYRNGNVIATTPNDGLYDDSTGTTGQATFMYKVCESGTQTCSNTVTVNFGP